MGVTRAAARGIVQVLLLLLPFLLVSCSGFVSLRRAEKLIDRGELLAAREILISRAEIDPNAQVALAALERQLLDWHLTCGREALNRGDLPGALTSFELAVTLHPESEAATRGRAEVVSRRFQRDAALQGLKSAALEGRWREAFHAAGILSPGDYQRPLRGLGRPFPPTEVFEEVRRRFFQLLNEEVRLAVADGDRTALSERIAEGEIALELCPPRTPVPHPSTLVDLIGKLDRWRELERTLKVARRHQQRAAALILGGEELEAWRHTRLALLRDPQDEELLAADIEFRRAFRESARVARDRAFQDCDPLAVRAALAWADELAEDWPKDAPASREEFQQWIVDDLHAQARQAESRGFSAKAILCWSESAWRSGDLGRTDRALRLFERLRSSPRLVVERFERSHTTTHPERLKVVMPALRVTQSIDRFHMEESAGWVRSGVRELPCPGHRNDVRRWRETLTSLLELRDAWLRSNCSRAALRFRRLQFYAEELTRLGTRLLRVEPTKARGVWKLQNLELLHERRRIEVEQTLSLTRQGISVGTLTVSVEDALSGYVPEQDLPGAGALSPGEAQVEGLRARLEVECRRRTSLLLDDLYRSEVERLVVRAHEVQAAGDLARAVEWLVEAWSQLPPGSGEESQQIAATLSEWTATPLSALLAFSGT